MNRNKCTTSPRFAFAAGIAVLIGCGISFVTVAAAQTGAQDNLMSSPALGIPQAPVGHRQPRPSDLPASVRREEQGRSASVAHAAPKGAPHVARVPGAGVPSYNIEAACRALAAIPEARIFDDVSGPDEIKRCVQDENQAREQLLKEWSQFKAADRAMCIGASSQGEVDPVYTELVTCLEMARDNYGSDTSTSPAQGGMYGLAPEGSPTTPPARR
jgi:hypothetical protein